ncbi:hypothetical protein OIU84_029988 [Salix udensis]|uniref:Uncharacterized protein n=1 Tax=Salix udensis TaxID=889485 RepID=A0AAD6KAL3_9ROSI|nr:hypothetical protein OIU84_029988 [Salix udensis]
MQNTPNNLILYYDNYFVDTKSGDQLTNRMLGDDDVTIIIIMYNCQLDFGTCGGLLLSEVAPLLTSYTCISGAPGLTLEISTTVAEDGFYTARVVVGCEKGNVIGRLRACNSINYANMLVQDHYCIVI